MQKVITIGELRPSALAPAPATIGALALPSVPMSFGAGAVAVAAIVAAAVAYVATRHFTHKRITP